MAEQESTAIARMRETIARYVPDMGQQQAVMAEVTAAFSAAFDQMQKMNANQKVIISRLTEHLLHDCPETTTPGSVCEFAERIRNGQG